MTKHEPISPRTTEMFQKPTSPKQTDPTKQARPKRMSPLSTIPRGYIASTLMKTSSSWAWPASSGPALFKMLAVGPGLVGPVLFTGTVPFAGGSPRRGAVSI